MANYPKFLEYMTSRGTVEKGKVSATGDNVDVPTPAAKDDPYHTNKSKKEQPQVKEYLNAQGKLVDPKVEEVPDYPGPDTSAPSKGVTSGKGWSINSPNTKDTPKPYKASTENAGQQSPQSGFGDAGDKRLKVDFETDVKKGTKVYSQTEQFLKQTQDMSLAEFYNFVQSQHEFELDEQEKVPGITANNTGEIYPGLSETARYVMYIANRNDRALETLVYEAQRSGGIERLIAALLEHPETYAALSAMMNDKTQGLQRSNRLLRAMQKFAGITEAVAKPIGFEDDEEDEEDVSPPMDGEDEEDPRGDDEMEDDLEDLDDDDEDEEDDEDMEDEDEDMPPPEEEDEEGPPGMGLGMGMGMEPGMGPKMRMRKRMQKREQLPFEQALKTFGLI